MLKLSIFVAVTVLGWVGWWLGAKVGIGTAFTVSSIGSFAGIWVGYRLYRDYLE